MRVARMRSVGVPVMVVALAAAAWFAIGIRQAHDLAAAQAILSGTNHPTRTQATRAASLLTSASFLNPDADVNLVRAQLALDQGRRGQAVRILEGVVRREPMNLGGWFQLAAHAPNAATFGSAVAEIGTLMANPR